jgi:hypothetical protein
VPIRLAAQSFAESSRRQRDRGERPGGRGLDEELPTIGEVGRDGASRIDPATRPILVHETDRQVANAMRETSDGERELAKRMLTERLFRIAAGTTHEKLDLRIHQNRLPG